MPSKSIKQQRLMGAAYAYATGKNKDAPEYIKNVAKSFMKKGKKKGSKALKDFAKTKHKGLPEKVTKIEERILNFSSFITEKYEFEDFTMSDMDFVQELYKEGMTDPKEISIECDLNEETVKQIIYTLRKRGDIE